MCPIVFSERSTRRKVRKFKMRTKKESKMWCSRPTVKEGKFNMKKCLNQKTIAIALAILAVVVIAIPAFAASAPQMENSYRCPACGCSFNNAKKWEKHRDKCFYDAGGPAIVEKTTSVTTTEATTAKETTTEIITEPATVAETTTPETTVIETTTSVETTKETTTKETTTHVVDTTVKESKAAEIKRAPMVIVPEIPTEITEAPTVVKRDVTTTLETAEITDDSFEVTSGTNNEFYFSEKDKRNDDIPDTGSSKVVAIATSLIVIASASVIAVKRKENNNIGA